MALREECRHNGMTSTLIACCSGRDGADEFVGEVTSAVDRSQRLDDRRGVHRHGAVVGGVEAILATKRVDVAVEDQANHFAISIDHR